MQSQDYAGAAWALGQRVAGATEASVDQAFDDGAYVRTHVLRPTWHFVAPEDLRWMLALTGPRLRRGDAHRQRALGIDDELVTASTRVFERAIGRSGPLTRQELRSALAEAGIVAAAGRLAHLVMHAELDGVICSGPRKGGTQTYALVEARVPAAPTRTRDEALAELAGRYVAGHGPAQDVDLAWWSGLSLGDARRGLAAASPTLEDEVIDGRTFWSAPGVAPTGGLPAAPSTSSAGAPSVHLLPNYDELLVAFRDRSDAIDPELPAAARAAQEILGNVIARDGLVIGWWRWATRGSAGDVALEPRVSLGSDDRRHLLAAAQRYAEFLGSPLEVAGLD